MAIVATFLPQARRSALKVMESLHTATPQELQELYRYRITEPNKQNNVSDYETSDIHNRQGQRQGENRIKFGFKISIS